MAGTYLQSIRDALHGVFAADPRVCLLGEDVLDPYGGAFKVTKGLSTRYPDRVLTTPICEGGFTGVAAGLALRGFKPIVEVMFGDFMTLCADQLVNHITKFRGMYADKVHVPLVIRTPMGGGRGYGATHSQTLDKLFLGVTGLTVVAPSHAHVPGDLLRHAVLQGTGPVLFLENKLLYPMPLLPPGPRVRTLDEVAGYPTVVVENFDKGTPDVTVVAYGGLSRMVLPLLARLEMEEIRLAAVFPSSLQPVPVVTLAVEAARSGRVVVAEEGTVGFNWGSEISAVLYERLWKRLAVPVRRLASAPGVIPAAPAAEEAALIHTAQLEAAILEVMS